MENCAHCDLQQQISKAKVKSILSKREAEVFAQVALGRTNKEAARALFVSEKTIKFHLTIIYAKLGIKSRAELISGWYTGKLDKDVTAYVHNFMPVFISTASTDEAPVSVAKLPVSETQSHQAFAS